MKRNGYVMNQALSRNRLISKDDSNHMELYRGDSRDLSWMSGRNFDLIVTSPPYWQQKDYGHPDQLGQEKTPKDYVASLISCLENWKPLLAGHASVFINIRDTVRNGSLMGIPARFVCAALDAGWQLNHEIVWSKSSGLPEPRSRRLPRRTESIIHLSLKKRPYIDLFGYSAKYGRISEWGEVWRLKRSHTKYNHPAAFPEELVERCIALAAPEKVCGQCGEPRLRLTERDPLNLDPSRKQAQKALALYHASKLTKHHLKAIASTGIRDSGKALLEKDGGHNSASVKLLAKEAKEVLGGYFREFTFPMISHAGWSKCDCKKAFRSSKILDPFSGCGTTLRVSKKLGIQSVGVDLVMYDKVVK